MRKVLPALFLAIATIATAPLALRADDQRVYDRAHKDYHQWNDAENRAYQHWWTEERHERQEREFNKLKRADQDAYWRWRHDHQDWH